MVNTEETLAAERPRSTRAAGAPVTSVAAPAAVAPVRRRLGALERERQIVAGATEFFARRGLDAQMRELAAEIGIAHTLLYHYFPTKRHLIERVYAETIAGRWDDRWEGLLDNPRTPVADKLHAFYREYLPAILTPDWLRILVHSGLSDGLIPDRYFAMVRERLFPRLLREARRAAGSASRARATPREEALLMAFHGGLIYHLGIWPLIYRQSYTGQGDAGLTDVFIADRIRGFLAQMPEVMPATRRRRAA
ncbi:MAG: TetR family transcriptional regulator [Leptothrix sp. (in: Bacteria)]|nr:TetR family transcriptional regulator [Leptothrix sp. (in: b-proteobacteria)]